MGVGGWGLKSGPGSRGRGPAPIFTETRLQRCDLGHSINSNREVVVSKDESPETSLYHLLHRKKAPLTPYQRAEAVRRRAAGETLVEIAKSFNVSHMTIARLGSE
jgi:hypothetical protein